MAHRDGAENTRADAVGEININPFPMDCRKDTKQKGPMAHRRLFGHEDVSATHSLRKSPGKDLLVGGKS